MDKAQLERIRRQAVRLLQNAGHTARFLCIRAQNLFIRFYHYCRASVQYYWPILLTRLRVYYRTFCQYCIQGYQYSASVSRALWLQLRSWFQRYWPVVHDRLQQYALLTRLHRPIGIFLLLWPALWALWFAAEGIPDIYILFVFMTGVVAMRSAGCVINDIADRHIDGFVARTRERPLVTGKVSVKEAIALAGALLLLALLLVLTLDPLTIKLSFIGAALAVLYPFTKRYTYLPQLFLGMAFGWAVPMAFAAQTGNVSLSGWILFMATVLWAVAYDTEYAMVDREDDIRMGVKSTAILFEDADRAIIGLIQMLVLLALALAGGRQELGWMYYTGLALAAMSALYQQYLIKDRIPEQCFRAFLNNNLFGAAVFAGIFLHYHFY